MSDHLLAFTRGRVCLPYDPEALIGAWDGLRGKMARQVPEAFSRDEWAYLMTFLASDQLWEVYESVFGSRCTPAEAGARMYYPRGSVAVWLPNNVSLLGPLVMILLSLTGNELRFKGGSRSEDLCAALLDVLRPGLDCRTGDQPQQKRQRAAASAMTALLPAMRMLPAMAMNLRGLAPTCDTGGD